MDFQPGYAYRPYLKHKVTGQELRFWVDLYQNRLIVTDKTRLQHGRKAGKPRYKIVSYVYGSQIENFKKQVLDNLQSDEYELKFLGAQSASWRKGQPRVKTWKSGAPSYFKKTKKHPVKEGYNHDKSEFAGFLP